MTTKLPRPLPTFTKDLRQAVRDKRKTRTRRVVNPQPLKDDPEPTLPGMAVRPWPPQTGPTTPGFPYGQIGDIAYLREPLVKTVLRFRKDGKPSKRDRYVAHYQDDGVQLLLNGKPLPWRWKRKVRRAEWLWEVTEEEALFDGIVEIERSLHLHGRLNGYGLLGSSPDNAQSSRIYAFKALWDSLNKKKRRAFGWESKPLAWVLGWEYMA